MNEELEDQDDSILQQVLDKDLFISFVGFDGNEIQIDYMYKGEQTDSMMNGRTTVILALSEAQQMAYFDIQETCEILIRDALADLRSS